MLIVTTESIPGRNIRFVIGEVIGVTARMNNAFTEGVRHLDGRAPRNVRRRCCGGAGKRSARWSTRPCGWAPTRSSG